MLVISDRHLRRRYIGEAAEVHQIVELALAGARSVITAIVDSERVAPRRNALQRIPEPKRSACCYVVDVGGHSRIDAGSERDRTLQVFRAGRRPIINQPTSSFSIL